VYYRTFVINSANRNNRKRAAASKAEGFGMLKTVLIVDDNSCIRQAVQKEFQCQSDFEVCGEAEDGKQALEKAQELRPELIVLDLSMPVMNGLETARILKQRMPEVAVIMFSDYSDIFSKQEARSSGISALVPKSGSMSDLIRTARALFCPVVELQNLISENPHS
jgi:two-component system nitrate/nitrite response regulator NarL